MVEIVFCFNKNQVLEILNNYFKESSQFHLFNAFVQKLGYFIFADQFYFIYRLIKKIFFSKKDKKQ